MPAITQLVVPVPEDLARATDEQLAVVWMATQAQSAAVGDWENNDLSDRLAAEIVRRWLGKVAPPGAKYGRGSYYWDQLRQFAKYVPGPKDDFHAGKWVLDPERPGHKEGAE